MDNKITKTALGPACVVIVSRVVTPEMAHSKQKERKRT